MITKTATYPWGERPLFYDSFVYKVTDEETNKVIDETWAKDESEMIILQTKFDSMKKKVTDVLCQKIKEYNSVCFEYLQDFNDTYGKIKPKTNNWSTHRILVYLCGFLSDNQNEI